MGASIPLSFSSEHPSLRRDNADKLYWEVLSHGPGDANTALLTRQGVVLENHDERREIGTVEPGSVRIDPDGRGRARIKLSDASWQMRIASGERPGVSVGYIHLSMLKEERGEDGLPVRYFSWQPEEISLLTAIRPADTSVGLYRSANTRLMRNKSIDELLDLALSGSRRSEEDRFTRQAFTEEYSLHRLMSSMIEEQLGGNVGGFEGELGRSVRSIGGDMLSGHFLRFECLLPPRRHFTRDTQAGIFSSGGALIQPDFHPFIELLFNRVLALNLGAEVVSGLQGDYVAPQVAAAAVPGPAVSAEIAAAQQADLEFSQQALTPARASIQVLISRQLLRQTGNGAEAAIRKTVRDQIGVVLDRLILFGQGGASEPLGIFNQPGVGAVAYAAAATWAKVLASEQSLADANADIGALAWGLSPSTRAKWKQAPRIAATNFPSFIMEGGEVNDYPALVTNQLAGQNQTIFGNWQDVSLLLWGDGLEVILDPITKASLGKVALTFNIWFNVLVHHPQSFCCSVDAGNQ